MAAAYTFAVPFTYTPGAAANAILQILAPAAKPVLLQRLEITQQGDAASTPVAVELDRDTAAGTGWTTTALTPADLNGNGTTAGSTVVGYASGTWVAGGTATALLTWGFNVLAGLLYLPVPEERVLIPAGQYGVVRFLTAPPASTVFAVNLVFQEL